MNNEDKILNLLESLVVGQNNISEDLKSTKNELENTNNRLEKLEQNQTELKTELQSLKEITLRMEKDHGEKLTTLFDGYKINYDKNKEIDKRITGIEHDIQKIQLQLKFHNLV